MADEPLPAASCGWVKMYHPCGALVTLPVVSQWKDKAKGFDYLAAFTAVSDMIGVGFTVNAPSLDDGEKRQEVGFIVRREKENQDRSLTPIIDLYSTNPAESFKFLSIYLNNDAQVEAFERASGVKLTNVKVFPGAAPERGKSKQSDAFITPVRPFPVIYGQNPQYDEGEAKKATQNDPYKVPKRVFIRWANLPAGQTSETKAAGGATPAKVNTESTAVDEKIVSEWAKWFRESEPNAADLQHKCRTELATLSEKHTKRAVWREVEAYMGLSGIEFNRNANTFHDPVDAEEQPAQGVPIPF